MSHVEIPKREFRKYEKGSTHHAVSCTAPEIHFMKSGVSNKHPTVYMIVLYVADIQFREPSLETRSFDYKLHWVSELGRVTSQDLNFDGKISREVQKRGQSVGWFTYLEACEELFDSTVLHFCMTYEQTDEVLAITSNRLHQFDGSGKFRKLTIQLMTTKGVFAIANVYTAKEPRHIHIGCQIFQRHLNPEEKAFVDFINDSDDRQAAHLKEMIIAKFRRSKDSDSIDEWSDRSSDYEYKHLLKIPLLSLAQSPREKHHQPIGDKDMSAKELTRRLYEHSFEDTSPIRRRDKLSHLDCAILSSSPPLAPAQEEKKLVSSRSTQYTKELEEQSEEYVEAGKDMGELKDYCSSRYIQSDHGKSDYNRVQYTQLDLGRFSSTAQQSTRENYGKSMHCRTDKLKTEMERSEWTYRDDLHKGNNLLERRHRPITRAKDNDGSQISPSLAMITEPLPTSFYKHLSSVKELHEPNYTYIYHLLSISYILCQLPFESNSLEMDDIQTQLGQLLDSVKAKLHMMNNFQHDPLGPQDDNLEDDDNLEEDINHHDEVRQGEQPPEADLSNEHLPYDRLKAVQQSIFDLEQTFSKDGDRLPKRIERHRRLQFLLTSQRKKETCTTPWPPTETTGDEFSLPPSFVSMEVIPDIAPEGEDFPTKQLSSVHHTQSSSLCSYELDTIRNDECTHHQLPQHSLHHLPPLQYRQPSSRRKASFAHTIPYLYEPVSSGYPRCPPSPARNFTRDCLPSLELPLPSQMSHIGREALSTSSLSQSGVDHRLSSVHSSSYRSIIEPPIPPPLPRHLHEGAKTTSNVERIPQLIET